ncbi:evC complex member EVC-like isoform X4 [Acipenser ruthenus]|uniref:evC complex member EVC-like isoform X4 n=1 Tax=Acipenser ruthenus TaxID=7906 RepID=UPI0027416A1F|nr:evC complex member EVC-like isoform X4 [Acipenser ruthenus]
MSDSDLLSTCSSHVFLEFAESFQVFPGLLALAIVIGVIIGIGVAVLLYIFVLKQAFFGEKFQEYDSKKLFENTDLDKEDNESDCASFAKKQSNSNFINDKERKLPLNSDVAAFALRAKVVYPINQRYRPLADGASNPSLHENSKLVILPNQMQEGSTSSSLESLSQEDDEDDSSHFISSSPVPKEFQNEKVMKLTRFPETLIYTSFDSRISLYNLGLQCLEQLDTELREERHMLFLQVFRILLNDWFHKGIIDEAFYSSTLLLQEKELEELKNQLHLNQPNMERAGDPDASYYTSEDIEKIEKHCLENGLRMNIQEKLIWWEYMAGTLQSRVWLVQREGTCRLRVAAKVLEHLTSDGELAFQEMEHMLSDLQCNFQEEIKLYTNECTKHTKGLVNEMVKKIDVKKKKLKKRQEKEKTRVQDTVQQICDAVEFVNAYHSLLEKQRQDCSDMEGAEDMRILDGITDLWKRQHSSCSQKMEKMVKEMFLVTLPSRTELLVKKCELLRQEARQDLSVHLQTEEANLKAYLKLFKDQLVRGRQSWLEEQSLSTARLKHLAEQQEKLLQGILVRQRDLHDGNGKQIQLKHSLFFQCVNKQFSARQFSLGALKEIRLSRLKCLLNELRQERTKEIESDDLSKTPGNQQKLQDKETSISEVERRLEQETQQIRLEFQQELISELCTAAELLQDHTECVIGRALILNARQQVAQPTSEENEGFKDLLKEAATESVYVTRESVNRLAQNYFTQIQNITEALEHDKQQRLRHLEDMCKNKQISQKQLNESLQKELANWSKKPTSTEFRQRVVLQKKKILTQYDLNHEATLEFLRQKKSVLDHMEKHLDGQLQEAEETFMTQLAALARVSLGRADSCTKDTSSEDKRVSRKKRSPILSQPSSNDHDGNDDGCSKSKIRLSQT